MNRTIPFRHRGATLMEVMTSIGTIALLSTLLLPALSDARRQGKAVHCLANLERLGAASAIYANIDSSENAIPVHPRFGIIAGAMGEVEWGGKAGRGEPFPDDALWGTAEGRGPATRGLNAILYGRVFPDYREDPGPDQVNWQQDASLDLDVFRCPSDSGYTGHNFRAWRNSRLTSFDHYGTSYPANASWIGVPGGDCKLESNSPFLKPVSRVPNPAQTVLFEENCGRFAWRANFGSPAGGSCSGLSGGLGNDVKRTIVGWHGKAWMFQTAFVDGHAREIRIKGHLQPQPQLGRYPPFSAHTTQHNFWHCVILRGPGWQLDTLPAPPVRTEINCGSSGAVINAIG